MPFGAVPPFAGVGVGPEVESIVRSWLAWIDVLGGSSGTDVKAVVLREVLREPESD